MNEADAARRRTACLDSRRRTTGMAQPRRAYSAARLQTSPDPSRAPKRASAHPPCARASSARSTSVSSIPTPYCWMKLPGWRRRSHARTRTTTVVLIVIQRDAGDDHASLDDPIESCELVRRRCPSRAGEGEVLPPRISRIVQRQCRCNEALLEQSFEDLVRRYRRSYQPSSRSVGDIFSNGVAVRRTRPEREEHVKREFSHAATIVLTTIVKQRIVAPPSARSA